MESHEHRHVPKGENQGPVGPPRALKILAWVIFGVGGAYYLWTQHRAHVLQYGPVALFLLCPFMHFFGGHGHHGGHSHEEHDDKEN